MLFEIVGVEFDESGQQPVAFEIQTDRRAVGVDLRYESIREDDRRPVENGIRRYDPRVPEDGLTAHAASLAVST
jgi:hypothetical protein